MVMFLELPFQNLLFWLLEEQCDCCDAGVTLLGLTDDGVDNDGIGIA